MKDIARELLKVAREVLGKAREGDMYVVKKDSGFVDVKGQEQTLKKGEIYKIDREGREMRLHVLRNGSWYYVDVAKDVFDYVVRSKVITKVDRKDMPEDASEWDDRMFVKFGKQNARELRRAMWPVVAKAAKKALDIRSSLVATRVGDGRYFFPLSSTYDAVRGSSASLKFDDVKWPKDLEAVMEQAKKRGKLKWIIQDIVESMNLKSIKKNVSTIVEVEGERVKTDFIGTVRFTTSRSRYYRSRDIKSTFKMKDPEALTKELNRLDAEEVSDAQDEIVKAVNGSLEEAVYDYLGLVESGDLEVDNVEWTWDPGQQGGYTDPSWGPYVEEVTYDDHVDVDIPYEYILNKAGVTDSMLEEAEWDESDAMRKAVKGMGMWDLEELPFTFSVAGEVDAPSTVVSMQPGVSDLGLVLSVEPDEEKITDLLTENDSRDEY
jgi:hypothetical protein